MREASILPSFTLTCVVLLGCGPRSDRPSDSEATTSVEIRPVPASETSSARTAAARTPRLPGCCKDGDELRRLDGQRVELEGMYKRTAVHKRMFDDAKERQMDQAARTASIRSGTTSVMLEVYHDAKGSRPTSELERFDGKLVRVVGTIRSRTPEQYHGDIPMQSMTGPCIVDVESIELAGSPR